MSGYDGPRRMRFLDGRTGLLSPFGIDQGGVYEVTDTTHRLAEEYREAGLIEYVGWEPDDAPAAVIEDTQADEAEEPVSDELAADEE